MPREGVDTGAFLGVPEKPSGFEELLPALRRLAPPDSIALGVCAERLTMLDGVVGCLSPFPL